MFKRYPNWYFWSAINCRNVKAHKECLPKLSLIQYNKNLPRIVFTAASAYLSLAGSQTTKYLTSVWKQQEPRLLFKVLSATASWKSLGATFQTGCPETPPPPYIHVSKQRGSRQHSAKCLHRIRRRLSPGERRLYRSGSLQSYCHHGTWHHIIICREPGGGGAAGVGRGDGHGRESDVQVCGDFADGLVGREDELQSLFLLHEVSDVILNVSLLILQLISFLPRQRKLGH